MLTDGCDLLSARWVAQRLTDESKVASWVCASAFVWQKRSSSREKVCEDKHEEHRAGVTVSGDTSVSSTPGICLRRFYRCWLVIFICPWAVNVHAKQTDGRCWGKGKTFNQVEKYRFFFCTLMQFKDSGKWVFISCCVCPVCALVVLVRFVFL